jgi:hypothetical protein
MPALQVLTKFFTDTIGETGSDICGGVLSTGHAFGYSMLHSFPALSIRDGQVGDAKQLLRTASVYTMKQIDENTITFNFEVHPQDWIRAHMVGFASEEIGFTSQGAEIAQIANDAVNGVPENCTWSDREGKSQTVVSIPSSDLLAAAKIVTKLLIRHKFTSISNGGKPQSISDIVCFNQKMLAMAEQIRDALLRGEKKLPAGTVHSTYIAAGTSLAMWKKSMEGGDVSAFMVELADNSMSMYEELEARLAA